MSKEEVKSLLPTIADDRLFNDIDLQSKDGDPRKTAYTVGWLHQFPNVVRAWREVGLFKKVKIDNPEEAKKRAFDGESVKIRGVADDLCYERRENMAGEHMVTVAAGAIALADMLVEKGVLSEGSQRIAAEASLVHDLNKKRQYWFSKLAQECSSEEEMEQRCSDMELPISDNDLVRIFQSKRLNEAPQPYGRGIFSPASSGVESLRSENTSLTRKLTSGVFAKGDKIDSRGERGLAAYDVTEKENIKLLQKFGFSREVIEIQEMVAHHSCPEIERVIDRLKYMREGGELAILMLVMHYVDDIVINPNRIDPGIIVENGVRKNTLNRRIDQNRENLGYKEYNEAWRDHNDKSETAFDMQERVGEMVEAKLAELLGVDDPKTLPALINERIALNIEINWRKLPRGRLSVGLPAIIAPNESWQ